MLRFKRDDGTNYPKWENTLLNKCATFHAGLTYSPEDICDENEGVLVLRSSNIQNSKIVYDDNVYVNKKIPDRLKPQEGDVLMCVRNGSKALVGKNAILSKEDTEHTWGAFMAVIRSNAPNGFIHYFLNSESFAKQMYINSGTATINQITKAMLDDCKLNIPSDPEEQEKIAECLSSVDALIADYEAQVENMQNQKKGVMQKLFSQEVRFKKDDGSDYPEWEYRPIGELYSPIKGAPLSKADISEEGTPFVLYGELYTTYSEVTTDIVRKTDKTVDEKYYSKGDDVIIPTSGETPEDISTSTCVVPKGVILAGDLNIYRNDAINGKFFSYVVNHAIKYDIARIAQGASVIHIKAEDVAKILMPVPCRDEQDKIVDCLMAFDDAIDDLQKTVEHWKNIKKGLLQQLFA